MGFNKNKFLSILLVMVFLLTSLEGLSLATKEDADEGNALDESYFEWIDDPSYKGGVRITGFKEGNIKNLILPDELDGKRVTSIGVDKKDEASMPVFVDKGIEKVKLPKHLLKIEPYSFADNEISSLKDIEFGEDIKTLSGFEFNENIGKIEKGDLPKNIINIGEASFISNRFSSIELPDQIRYIGPSAFSSIKLEGDIKLSKDLKVIDQQAFYSFNKSSIDLPEGLKVIKENAFCKSELENINIPDSVEQLEREVFSGTKIRSIKFPESIETIPVGILSETSLLSEVIIPEGVKKIGRGAFRGAENLSTIKLPESLVEIEKDAFEGTSIKFDELKFGPNLKKLSGFKGTELSDSSKLTIPVTVEVIGDNAFQNVFIEEIVFPEGVKEIGKEAFKKTIWGNNNWEKPSKTRKLNFPNSLRKIGEGAFSQNWITSLKDVNFNSELKELNGFSENKISSIEKEDLPEALEIISKHAFSDNEISSIELSDSVKKLEEDSFSSNNISSLKNVKYSENLKYLSGFKDNQIRGIGEGDFKDSLETIGKNAFKNENDDHISGYGKLHLPEGLKRIEEGAFSNWKINDTPESLKENDEGKDVKLADMELPNSLEYLSGFDTCSLVSIDKEDIPKTVTTIGVRAFKGNRLKVINLPDNIKRIERASFASNPLGEQDEDGSYGISIGKINMGSGIEYISLFGDVNNGWEDGYPIKGNLKDSIPKTVKTLGEYTFKKVIVKENQKLIIPDNIKRIEKSAFESIRKADDYSTSLTTDDLVFNENLEYLSGFKYGNFKEIKLPKRLKVIGEDAFKDAYLANGIELPESLEEIEKQAFFSTQIVEEDYELPKNLKKIGENAFMENTGIEYMEIPENIEEFGNGSLYKDRAVYDIINYSPKWIKEDTILDGENESLYNIAVRKNLKKSKKDRKVNPRYDGDDYTKKITGYGVPYTTSIVSYEKDRKLVEDQHYQFENFVELNAFDLLVDGKEKPKKVTKEHKSIELKYNGKINEIKSRKMECMLLLDIANVEKYIDIKSIEGSISGKEIEKGNISVNKDSIVVNLPRHESDGINEFNISVKGDFKTKAIGQAGIRAMNFTLKGTNIKVNGGSFRDEDTKSYKQHLVIDIEKDPEQVDDFIDYSIIYKTDKGKILKQLDMKGRAGSYKTANKLNFEGYHFLEVVPANEQIQLKEGQANKIVYTYTKSKDKLRDYSIIYKTITGKHLFGIYDSAKIGSTISSEEKYFKGYELLSVTPLDGKINIKKDGDNTIVYLYKLEGGSILNKDDHRAYIAGYPCGNVKPENKLTREEAGAIICRILDDEYRAAMEQPTSMFSDVKVGKWSCGYLGTLENAGILNGYKDGTFRPAKSITRAELAVALARTENIDIKAEGTDPKGFKDTKGHWAEEYILKAEAKGWVSGYEDGTFKPDKAITRAEFITIVNKTLERQAREENMIFEGIKKFKDIKKGQWYYLDVIEATNSHDYEYVDGHTKWTELTGEEVY